VRPPVRPKKTAKHAKSSNARLLKRALALWRDLPPWVKLVMSVAVALVVFAAAMSDVILSRLLKALEASRWLWHCFGDYLGW
jgi:negative regulator of sigma E activity